MKTLIFNGSPRKNGDSAALIRQMSEHLRGEIEVVSSYYDGISPCIDCRYCTEKPGCSIDDKMTGVYHLIESCDNIVIASPIYFSELSGSLLALMSRLQTYYCARRFRKKPVKMSKKRGAIILTGGGDGSPERANETAATLLKLMNAECVAYVLSHNTDKMPAAQDEWAMSAARAAAELLNG